MVHSLAHSLTSALKALIIAEVLRRSLESAGEERQRVIFQCKRCRAAIDSATARDFRGAMQGRSDKGPILTTSRFTRGALRDATRDGAPAVDLIDGEQVVVLLKRLGQGVRAEWVVLVTPEPDWFKGL